MVEGQKLTPFQNHILDTLNSIGGTGTAEEISNQTGFAVKAITNSLRSLRGTFLEASVDEPAVWSVMK